MYNLTLNHTLMHANRSFDINTPVDPETVKFLNNMIDEFLEEDLKPISQSQIMKYYTPKWLAAVGIVSSIISSI